MNKLLKENNKRRIYKILYTFSMIALVFNMSFLGVFFVVDDVVAGIPGGSGSIWTTLGDCGDSSQDVNHYAVGDHVHINGNNFLPGESIGWNITGLPSSSDNGSQVASGALLAEVDGSFCVDAYTVLAGDDGIYKASANGKTDNYQVDSTICGECSAGEIQDCIYDDSGYLGEQECNNDRCWLECEPKDPPEECGDGTVNGIEECDDGNLDDGDGCDASCIFEYCGDGVVNNTVEECEVDQDCDQYGEGYTCGGCSCIAPPEDDEATIYVQKYVDATSTAGWEMSVYANDGDVSPATSTTVADGWISFVVTIDDATTTVQVNEVPQSGYILDEVICTLGADGPVIGREDCGCGGIYDIEVADEDEIYCSFFNVTEPAPTGTVTICKQEDLNGDGILNEGEPVVTDPLWWFTFDGNPYQATTTGCAVIEDVPYGTYEVSEQNLLGWIPTGVSGNVTEDNGYFVTVGEANDFPIVYFLNERFVIPTGSIGGCKYDDVDNDGDIEGDETLEGWEIELWSYTWAPPTTELVAVRAEFVLMVEPGVPYLSATTTTGENGCYSFDDLGIGWYSVNEIMQEHWTQTYASATTTFWFDPVVPSDMRYNFGNYEEDYCGDGDCNGEEDCDNCEEDCGVCEGGCTASYTYTTDADFDEGVLLGVEYTTVSDQLQLGEGEVTTFPVMWVANASEDSVSKWDTENNVELARYHTWFGPKTNHSAWSGPAPSRTAVDSDGNAYIANRQFSTWKPDVFKIFSDDWVDRNSNGVLDTSVDVNSDGVIDASEMLPMTDSNSNGVIDDDEIMDERIAWVTQVSNANGKGRSLAIDLNGDIWLGSYDGQLYYKLDGDTGVILEGPISVSGHRPYGALVDKYGILWGASLSNNMLRLDTANNSVQIKDHSQFGSNYGIAIGYDDEGYTQVYLGSGSGHTYIQYDSKTDTFSTPAEIKYTVRGVATDSQGNIIAGAASNGIIELGGAAKFAPDGSLIWKAPSQVGSSETRGTVVASDDNIWLVHVYANKISKVNGVDGTPMGVFDSGLGPYTYSDATGLGLRGSLSVGTWNVVNDSTLADMSWQGISWNSSVPEGSSMTVKVRSSNDASTWSVWQDVNSGDNLSTVPDGRYLEVQVSMQAETEGDSPILYDLTLDSDCGDTPPPESYCGDGAVDAGEQCDDGNNTSGDGCSSTCTTESSGGGGGSTPLCILRGDCGGSTPVSTPDPVEEVIEEVIVLGEEGAPSLTITKGVNVSIANPGDTLNYSVLITNNGNLEAFNVEVVDELPDGLQYMEDESTIFSWNLGDIPAGESRDINYQVKVLETAEAGNYENVAIASADNHDNVMAEANVEVIIPVVLAETGIDFGELAFLFIFGVTAIVGGRRLELELNL